LVQSRSSELLIQSASAAAAAAAAAAVAAIVAAATIGLGTRVPVIYTPACFQNSMKLRFDGAEVHGR
jgi:hypothetical protein